MLDLLELIYVNFSFPWLILIALLMFKKPIRELINNISDIKYKDLTIKSKVKEILIEENSLIKSQNPDAYGKQYVPPEGFPPVGAGGMPYKKGEPLKSVGLQSLYSDEILENFSQYNGSNETIKQMFEIYRDDYVYRFKLDSKDSSKILKDMESYNSEEVNMFKAIEKVYKANLKNEYIKDLWELSDILKYKRMIQTSLYKRNEHLHDTKEN